MPPVVWGAVFGKKRRRKWWHWVVLGGMIAGVGLLLVGCGPVTPPPTGTGGPSPLPPTMPPTGTSTSLPTDIPTGTPAGTPLPTYAPPPTYTPMPTYTPAPSSTWTLVPPVCTPTIPPTHTPTPSLPGGQPGTPEEALMRMTMQEGQLMGEDVYEKMMWVALDRAARWDPGRGSDEAIIRQTMGGFKLLHPAVYESKKAANAPEYQWASKLAPDVLERFRKGERVNAGYDYFSTTRNAHVYLARSADGTVDWWTVLGRDPASWNEEQQQTYKQQNAHREIATDVYVKRIALKSGNNLKPIEGEKAEKHLVIYHAGDYVRASDLNW